MASEIGINRSVSYISKKPKKAWLIISLIIITLLLAGAGVGYWQLTKSFNKQKNELQKQIDDLNTKLTTTNAKIKDLSAKEEKAEETAFDYNGWETYINDVYKYQFKYPSGTEIIEAEKEAFVMTPDESAAGKTFDELYNELTGKICLLIKYGDASINISAPENADFSRVICGRTGIGSEEERTSVEETLTINGKIYTASGDKGSSDSTLILKLDDGTRIEYGGDLVNEDTALVIRRIIESYKPI